MKILTTVATAFLFIVPGLAFAQEPPSGSIVPWIPPPDSIDAAKNSIKFPRGWKPCAMELGEQPLFLGAVSPEAYLASIPDKLGGGRPDHDHTVKIDATATIENDIDKGPHKNAAGAGHSHPVTVSKSEHIPPFVKVVLLCKQ